MDMRDPELRYYAVENRRRNLEHENAYWHSEAGQYHLRYNAARDEEISKRNAEIMHNLKNLYFSNKIAAILIISLVITVLTFPWTVLIQGLIVWNAVIIVLLGVYYFVTAKTKVRPEIKDREEMIRLSAHQKAFR